MAKVPHDPDEVLALVDEQDNVIGKAKRRTIHEPGRFHRHASVLILNAEGQILLQTRDNGKLDYSASGHFPYDMDYLDAAVKETEEELGLKIDKSRFKEVLKVLYRNETGGGGTFVCLFEVKGDYKLSQIRIDPLEVDSVRYYSIDEIKSFISSSPKPVGFARIMKQYLDKSDQK
jgi:isopentenyl-diphosphate Delta-isomerase